MDVWWCLKIPLQPDILGEPLVAPSVLHLNQWELGGNQKTRT